MLGLDGENQLRTIILVNKGARERAKIAGDMINLYCSGHKANDLSAENAMDRQPIRCTSRKYDRTHVQAQSKYCKGWRIHNAV